MSNLIKRYFVGEEKLFDQYLPNWRQQVNNDVRYSNDKLKILIELNVTARFDSAFNAELGIQKMTLDEVRAYLTDHAAEWEPVPAVENKQQMYQRDELMTLNKTTLKEIASNQFAVTTEGLTKIQLIDAIIEGQGGPA